jgi:PhzF family phenazine biosynthesis protein
VLAAQQLINGPRWLGLLLDRAETVTAIAPDHAALATLALVGVIGRNLASVSASASASASVSGSGSGSASASASASGSASASEIRGDFEVRAFTAAAGIKEDPVTGSLNAALAQWLIADGLAPAAYIVSQGGCVQRDGRVRIESAAPPQADGASGLIREVWVGGDCVTCVQGQVEL